MSATFKDVKGFFFLQMNDKITSKLGWTDGLVFPNWFISFVDLAYNNLIFFQKQYYQASFVKSIDVTHLYFFFFGKVS